MVNIGPAELLVIFLVALVVLGPNKLPDAARQAGKMMAELRRLSGGFQEEMRAAMREPAPKAPTPTLPPLVPDPGASPAPTADAGAVPDPGAPKPPRKRREPLRADGAVPAEQQLQQD